MADIIWFVAVAIGPLMLGGAIAYGLLSRRDLSKDERKQQRRSIRDLYNKKGS
ncbi:hypothetical protein [Rhizobium paknamense]|uniref:Uncharacterized protein n=1 Tax=Rhizobium paknamense TaxID=1206817 RepID=A0ABU0IED1_9HYPH|nr:hypothetical protein [Rhizobium paknamense]MDQ0455574.1 hypothetical protein [Rhizobium paknamense]